MVILICFLWQSNSIVSGYWIYNHSNVHILPAFALSKNAVSIFKWNVGHHAILENLFIIYPVWLFSRLNFTLWRLRLDGKSKAV